MFDISVIFTKYKSLESTPKSLLLPRRRKVSKFHKEYIIVNHHFVIPYMRDWWLSGIFNYWTYRSGLKPYFSDFYEYFLIHRENTEVTVKRLYDVLCGQDKILKPCQYD